MACLDAKLFGKYNCHSQSKRIKTLKEKTAVNLSELPSEDRLLRLLHLTPERGGGEMGMQMDSEGIITTQTAALAFLPLRTYKDFLSCLTSTSTHQTAVTSGDCRGLGLQVNRSIVFPLEHLFLLMS